MRKENTANVMGIFQLARGFNFFADNTVADCELMLLLFRDNSISQIAHLKRKPKKEIIKNIDMLIQKNQLSSLDELRAFSKKVFTPQKARDF